jgi:ABC-2 type transport system permease protein
MRTVLAVARIERARLLRTPAAFTLLLLVPALQVLLFGTAIRPEGATVTVAVAAPTPRAWDAAAKRLRDAGGFAIVGGALRPGGAEAAVRHGAASIGIEVPEVRSFANPTAPDLPVRVIADAANATLTATATAAIEAAYWREAAQRGDLAVPRFAVERLYNPPGRADWTFLPALIGVTMMISMIMLGCLSLTREREGGTWETLLSLPGSRAAVMAGKALPYVVLGSVQGLLVLGIGVSVFALPVRGAAWALVLLLPVFAAAHFMIGYAISARARTQVAALQGAVAFYLPAMLLSGFLYPFETLPAWAQRLGALFPLTHMIRAARDALLRGADAASVFATGGPILVALIVATLAGLWLQARNID